MKYSYLDLIMDSNLNDFVRACMHEVFPGFSTVNPAYKERLLRMQGRMSTYINDESLNRPLLYLILGPPGAGKSYLVPCQVSRLIHILARRTLPVWQEQRNPSNYQLTNEAL
jgi:pantothenate kinase-related protein Tda10